MKTRERSTHLDRHSTSSSKRCRRCMSRRGCKGAMRLQARKLIERERKKWGQVEVQLSTSSSPIPCNNWATKKNQTFHDKSSMPEFCSVSEHSEIVPFLVLPQTLLSGLAARYGPTRKWGRENVRKPTPITMIPHPTHFGFDAPTRPPK